MLLVPAASPLVLAARTAGPGADLSPSLQAGEYVCNAVFFHSLWLARQQAGRRQVAFLHLPVRVGGFGLAREDTLNRSVHSLEAALTAAVSVLQMLGPAAQQPSAGEHRLQTGAACAPDRR